LNSRGPAQLDAPAEQAELLVVSRRWAGLATGQEGWGLGFIADLTHASMNSAAQTRGDDEP